MVSDGVAFERASALFASADLPPGTWDLAMPGWQAGHNLIVQRTNAAAISFALAGPTWTVADSIWCSLSSAG